MLFPACKQLYICIVHVCLCMCLYCMYVRSHHETVDTKVLLVSSVSPELEAFCPSVWPDPSEEDTTEEE